METTNPHNDSTFFSRLSKRANPNGDSFVVPPRQAFEEQSKQFQKVAEAEIQELKQSLRYVEIQLARSREEIETQNNKINDQQSDIEKANDNLGKQVRINQQQAKTIEDLQKKIESFNSNNRDLLEKNRFKASTYMSEINQREEELGRMRAQLLNNQDEMKLLTVSREQLRQQKDALTEQMRTKDMESDKLRRKCEEMSRLVENMTVAQKNMSDFIGGEDHAEMMERARDDIERADRIARTTNKSSFMGLGDKQPRLVSEEHLLNSGSRSNATHSGGRNVADPYRAMIDDSYLNDDSIPAEIFQMIQLYRDRLSKSRGHTQTLVIDDFFADVHRVLKDVQMREIARIRNEHSVEIMKLRKNLEQKLRQEGGVLSSSQNKANLDKSLKSKENFKATKNSEKFAENEVERQRRALFEENEILKQRVRALETIVQSGSTEKSKFMEGASWIAKKTHVETEKHIQKLGNLIGEFNQKTQTSDYIIDHSITELNGREVLKVNKWLVEQMERQINEVGERFESIFENVNYHLKEATKNFHSYK
eukprot:403363090